MNNNEKLREPGCLVFGCGREGVAEFILKYLWLVLPVFGLLYLFLTPPFQVPDEPAHFLRAFGISDGFFIAQKQNNATGSRIPEAVIHETRTLRGDLSGHPERKTSLKDIIGGYKSSEPLNARVLLNRSFAGYSSTALYSPVPYIPQAAAIIVAKLFSMKILSAMYLARVFNLMVSALLIWLALKISKRTKPVFMLFAVLAFTPMSVFQISSCSPDSLLISLSLLVVALVMDLRFSGWSDGKFSLFLMCSCLLALSKSVYLLIPCCILPVIFSRGSKTRVLSALILFGLAILPAIAWSLLAGGMYVPVRTGGVTDPGDQLRFFASHLYPLLTAFLFEAWDGLQGYLLSFIGCLGWLDTPVSGYKLYLWWMAAVALISCDSEDDQIKAGRNDSFFRVTLLIVSFLTVFLICLSMYFIWGSPRAMELVGVQGRYFIPCSFVLFSALGGSVKIPGKYYSWIFFATAVFILVFQGHALSTLFRRYYG